MARCLDTFRNERGAGGLGMVGLLLPAVMVAGVGGFVLQRAVSDDGAAAVELPDNRHAAPVLACPGGPAVSELHNGDRIFAIATHDELDGWLLIRNPVDPSEHWYIESRWVTADAATDELPEVGCDDPVPVDDGDLSEVAAGPDESTTTTDPNESTTTTEPDESDDPDDTDGSTPTTTTLGRVTTSTTQPPTTETTVDTTMPSLTISVSEEDIWEAPQTGICPSETPTQTVISAVAGDASGIESVRATWKVGNYNENRNLISGSTTFGAYPNGTVAQYGSEAVIVTVTAEDTAGNHRTRTIQVTVHSGDCFG